MKNKRMNTFHLVEHGYDKKEEVCDFADEHGLIVDWEIREYYTLIDPMNRQEIIDLINEIFPYEIKKTTRSAETKIRKILNNFMYVRSVTTSKKRLFSLANELMEKYHFQVDEGEISKEVEVLIERYKP